MQDLNALSDVFVRCNLDFCGSVKERAARAISFIEAAGTGAPLPFKSLPQGPLAYPAAGHATAVDDGNAAFLSIANTLTSELRDTVGLILSYHNRLAQSLRFHMSGYGRAGRMRIVPLFAAQLLADSGATVSSRRLQRRGFTAKLDPVVATAAALAHAVNVTRNTGHLTSGQSMLSPLMVTAAATTPAAAGVAARVKEQPPVASRSITSGAAATGTVQVKPATFCSSELSGSDSFSRAPPPGGLPLHGQTSDGRDADPPPAGRAAKTLVASASSLAGAALRLLETAHRISALDQDARFAQPRSASYDSDTASATIADLVEQSGELYTSVLRIQERSAALPELGTHIHAVTGVAETAAAQATYHDDELGGFRDPDSLAELADIDIHSDSWGVCVGGAKVDLSVAPEFAHEMYGQEGGLAHSRSSSPRATFSLGRGAQGFSDSSSFRFGTPPGGSFAFRFDQAKAAAPALGAPHPSLAAVATAVSVLNGSFLLQVAVDHAHALRELTVHSMVGEVLCVQSQKGGNFRAFAPSAFHPFAAHYLSAAYSVPWLPPSCCFCVVQSLDADAIRVSIKQYLDDPDTAERSSGVPPTLPLAALMIGQVADRALGHPQPPGPVAHTQDPRAHALECSVHGVAPGIVVPSAVASETWQAEGAAGLRVITSEPLFVSSGAAALEDSARPIGAAATFPKASFSALSPDAAALVRSLGSIARRPTPVVGLPRASLADVDLLGEKMSS